jgi:hypothetical protein
MPASSSRSCCSSGCMNGVSEITSCLLISCGAFSRYSARSVATHGSEHNLLRVAEGGQELGDIDHVGVVERNARSIVVALRALSASSVLAVRGPRTKLSRVAVLTPKTGPLSLPMNFSVQGQQPDPRSPGQIERECVNERREVYMRTA